jgi:hypothetical protein
MSDKSSRQSSGHAPSRPINLYKLLRLGPLLAGEVRGFKSEMGKKFDKSDKSAPPITFGVFKMHLELLEEGSPVMVSVYGHQGECMDGFAEKIGLRRGAVVVMHVSKTEYKDGQRKVVCSAESIYVLNADEEAMLRAA